MPSPDVGNAQTVLNDAVALSPSNVWAVGYTNSFGGGASATVLRWNGSSWIVAPAPPLGSLDAVTALSPSDIWATGSDSAGLPMLANWGGSGWTVTPAPSAGGTGAPLLVGIAALAPSSVWAVGWTWDGTTGRGNPLAARIING